MPSTSANTSATSFSAGVDGAVYAAPPYTGAGNAPRSSLPTGPTGNASSTTNAAGTMYDGT
ncbi:hypothetical protein, partial [Rhodococcus sp. 14C212]|uniref:hypothetical protein n=1 Tax=Rhodococcus sp. 14C212 TaxID=2711209 RepID=UPI00197D9137